MSRIIKSTKVAVGSTVAIDMAPLIKKAKENQARALLETQINKQRMSEMQVYEEGKLDNSRNIVQGYLEEAQKKAELLFENEMEKARSEGIKRAEQETQNMITQAKEDAKNILEEVIALKKNAMEEYNNMFNSMGEDVIDLVWSIAERVLNREIERDGEYIIGIVAEAMEEITEKRNVILKVSDIDYANVIGNKEIITARVEGFGDVDVIKESSLKPGSCIVETKYGTIDGGIATRVKQIKKEVEKIING